MMKTPSPELMNMWRETMHVHMRMILLCLESGRPVPQGLRKRTYGPEFLEYLEEQRSEYSKKLAELPSPTEKAPEYGRHYVMRVHSHAQALDAVRRELKHLNLRVDLDDSQKRQKRPGIIRRYIELRRGFSEWLKQWEEEAIRCGHVPSSPKAWQCCACATCDASGRPIIGRPSVLFSPVLSISFQKWLMEPMMPQTSLRHASSVMVDAAIIALRNGDGSWKTASGWKSITVGNPRDQTFVRSIMENLTDSDAKMIPGFGPGQGIVSGQVVRFPLPVRVKMDRDLLASEIGDEDFFEQAESWKPDRRAPARKVVEQSMAKVQRNRRKPAAAASKSAAKTSRGARSRGKAPKAKR